MVTIRLVVSTRSGTHLLSNVLHVLVVVRSLPTGFCIVGAYIYTETMAFTGQFHSVRTFLIGLSYVARHTAGVSKC